MVKSLFTLSHKVIIKNINLLRNDEDNFYSFLKISKNTIFKNPKLTHYFFTISFFYSYKDLEISIFEYKSLEFHLDMFELHYKINKKNERKIIIKS
jgi:hypothetical protein